MNILMENLFITQFHKQKHLTAHAKYVSMKENKNLLNQIVIIKFVQTALKNFKNKKSINYVHYVDNMTGIKQQKIIIIHMIMMIVTIVK